MNPYQISDNEPFQRHSECLNVLESTNRYNFQKVPCLQPHNSKTQCNCNNKMCGQLHYYPSLISNIIHIQYNMNGNKWLSAVMYVIST